MMGFVKCKVSVHVRVRFPIISTEMETEACELLGAGICLRHQDTPCRQLALRKPGWGRGLQSAWEVDCARAPRPRKVLGWNIERKRRVVDP